tara:strand:+ start:98 stop:379 length:282 start_codon:yes stop_codon:yes gene_type:complete
MRITNTNLQYKIDTINELLGYDKKPNKFLNGKLKANVGTFYISKAYGGYRIEQICNEGGGCIDISYRGTKKECYYWAKGIIEGIKQANKMKGA